MDTVVDIISTVIDTLVNTGKDVFTFIKIYIFDIPKLLIEIFSTLPFFFRFGLGVFISFIVLFIISKFFVLIKSMIKS